MERFSGKTVFVTGGSSGIGLATCSKFLSQGANVFVVAHKEEPLDTALMNLSEISHQVAGTYGDVSDPKFCRDAVDKCLKRFESLDIAVNAAGSKPVQLPLTEVSDSMWKQVIDTNLNGVFYSSREELRVMENNLGGGVIINITSVVGLNGAPSLPAYIAAKHGVVGLTKSIAIDYAAKNIRCLAIAPGGIRTPMYERTAKETMDVHLSNVPGVKRGNLLDRLGETREVASVIAFLSSDEASYLTGIVVPVDGGWSSY